MRIKELSKTQYEVDEFGRILIDDDTMMEYITGASDLAARRLDSNSACGSNGACSNISCKKR